MAQSERTAQASTITGLFDLSLEYKSESGQRTSAEGRPGEYIGSGVGVVRGERVNGAVRWDLFEAEETDRCEASFVGEIVTDDGATVAFETHGWIQASDAARPQVWQTRSIVLFKTDSAAYSWLDGQEAVWEGEADLSVWRHEARVYTVEE